MRSKKTLFQRISLVLTLLAGLWAPAASAVQITVFAAASLKESLEQIAASYERQTSDQVRLSMAGSSTLARQIEQGAPADIYLSANPDWMDWLQDRGLIDAATRVDLLRNRLVLIAPTRPRIKGLDFGDGRIAMALVDAVPAGIYGKAALETLGEWPALQSRVVQTDNVRAALALVALGEAPRGIVYQTDALAEPRVQVLAEFPADSHPPIIYPAAIVAGRDSPASQRFMAYLLSDQARAIFGAAGFAVMQADR
ncbi:molybdate ABC transporter substrate-binding protein [Actibacterium ureilyticum]|uniref:molybdate ABC transporter substrate-binding protein n=1 Tax=Actibacterium ureilyticum TaxID=1590614 RepID=UPI001FEC48E5|nr:molybdate ABC transporter substrate-binding protein [Actibacterium ureilyticum]